MRRAHERDGKDEQLGCGFHVRQVERDVDSGDVVHQHADPAHELVAGLGQSVHGLDAGEVCGDAVVQLLTREAGDFEQRGAAVVDGRCSYRWMLCALVFVALAVRTLVDEVEDGFSVV